MLSGMAEAVDQAQDRYLVSADLLERLCTIAEGVVVQDVRDHLAAERCKCGRRLSIDNLSCGEDVCDSCYNHGAEDPPTHHERYGLTREELEPALTGAFQAGLQFGAMVHRSAQRGT